MSANKIKRITYLISQTAERGQESCTSDGAVKITLKKWYQLETDNILLIGLTLHMCTSIHINFLCVYSN